ncbi:MAG: DUF2254 domain-containing protein, partial [Myxococcales bacterium]|nr:DUF2254 domain-containing protein [Myxococcales bacterium]
WTKPFLMILALATFIFLLAFWLDILTTAPGQKSSSLASLGHSILFQDVDQARNTLGGLGEVMAAVLGLALTVSSIIVQLAATRFTPYITNLFFRARTNLLVLGFFVTSTVFVVWVNFAIGDDNVPRWGVLFSMILMTMSLGLLFPYFAYVFDFLDPEKIVGRITADGLYASTPIKGKAALEIDQRQLASVEAVEHLANISLNACQQKDKNIASSAVDALGRYAILYGDTKAGMLKEWHKIPQWLRQSPDFVSLSRDAIADLSDREIWLEWKVLRQYQMLFSEGLTQIKDLCYLIAIDTRRLGEAASKRGDLHALDLAIKFFNTYLRATINAKDIRTAYNILHQYRQLGEVVLMHANHPGIAPEGREMDLEQRTVDIARFMRYYSAISFQRGMAFLTEVIAHDIGTLCGYAFRLNSRSHDNILDIFLRVDDSAESAEEEKTLRGVRRAQIKLATTYLVFGGVHLARRISDDMQGEPEKRLRSIWHELRSLESREFWEVNDRGTNFDYLTPQQKDTLPTFFGWFEDLRAPEREDSVTLPVS